MAWQGRRGRQRRDLPDQFVSLVVGRGFLAAADVRFVGPGRIGIGVSLLVAAGTVHGVLLLAPP